MPWISDDQAFDYRFLPSGALEYQDRQGRYRLAWGASSADYHDFWHYQREMAELLRDCPEDETIDSLYLNHPRFQHVADRLLELSGLDPRHIAPKMIRWLLFPLDKDTPAPLMALNTPAERKHPPLSGGEPITDRVALLVALTAQCDGDLSKAVELARSMPAKEAFAVMEERAWASASAEDKGKAWARQRIEEMRARGQTSVLNPQQIAQIRAARAQREGKAS